jgi:hypothetical protein
MDHSLMKTLMDQLCNKLSVGHMLVNFATKKGENLNLGLAGCDLSPDFMKAYAVAKF